MDSNPDKKPRKPRKDKIVHTTRRGTSDAPKLGPLIDLTKVRDVLDLDKVEMAARLTSETATFAPAAKATEDSAQKGYPIWYTRVHEWENRSRAVPDYAFIAYAKTIVDEWKAERKREKIVGLSNVDVTYASLLHPAYGVLLKSAKEVLVASTVDSEKGSCATMIHYFSQIEDSFHKTIAALYGKANVRLPKLIKG